MTSEQIAADRNLFTCKSCMAIWSDPVTIKCGHTFCRQCFQKDSSRECRSCRELFDRDRGLRTNVLLSAVVEKCFPGVTYNAELKSKNNKILLDRKISEAAEKAPDDFELLSCHSQTCIATDHFQEALEDVEHVIQLQPELPEGFLMTAEVSRNFLEVSPSVETTGSSALKTTVDDLSDRGSDSDHGSLLAGHQSDNALKMVDQSVSEDVSYELSSKCPVESKKQSLEELLTTEDFECTLCLRLLFYPVTTQCGHIFCRDCIYRSLDYRSVCPLCKESLAEFLAERREATTEAVEMIIERFFAKELEIRGKLQHEDTMRLPRGISDNRQEIPIFVCTVAYPSVRCPLRIFEPRYRLMMRRCVETGTRQFGMCTCLDSREENFSEYGTVLEIRGIEYLPDGQSYVDCIGGRRFRVLSRGMKDGYHTAEVDYLRDETPAMEQLDDLQQLQADVHVLAVECFASIPSTARATIVRSFGDFPALMPAEAIGLLPDGPTWIWFMTAILPLDQGVQLSLLSMTSLRDRLVAIHRVLQYFQRRGYRS